VPGRALPPSRRAWISEGPTTPDLGEADRRGPCRALAGRHGRIRALSPASPSPSPPHERWLAHFWRFRLLPPHDTQLVRLARRWYARDIYWVTKPMGPVFDNDRTRGEDLMIKCARAQLATTFERVTCDAEGRSSVCPPPVQSTACPRSSAQIRLRDVPPVGEVPRIWRPGPGGW
jgi:hypothetical protein